MEALKLFDKKGAPLDWEYDAMPTRSTFASENQNPH